MLCIGRALSGHLSETLACTRAVLRHACGSNWQVGGPLTDAADVSFALPQNPTQLHQRCAPYLPAAFWRLLLCSLRSDSPGDSDRVLSAAHLRTKHLQAAVCDQQRVSLN